MRGLPFLVSFSVIAAFPGSSLCLGQVTGAVIEARGAARPANANATYLALRGALPGGDGVAVKEFTLERQGGEFHFEQGSFYFYGPVNGRVTGAVFLGKGRFALSPKDVREQHSLAQLTKSGVMSQEFSTIQQRLGLLNHDRSYWQEVTPHEVAHQWWGQLVGFNSYRDQWMSEGFANFRWDFIC